MTSIKRLAVLALIGLAGLASLGARAQSGPQPKLLSLLLDKGAAIDALSPNGTTPLMMAARYGNEDGAHLLLAKGANAKLRNEKGLTAADFARTGGREALAAKLEQAAR
jgi:ankyrin repeat protein